MVACQDGSLYTVDARSGAVSAPSSVKVRPLQSPSSTGLCLPQGATTEAMLPVCTPTEGVPLLALPVAMLCAGADGLAAVLRVRPGSQGPGHGRQGLQPHRQGLPGAVAGRSWRAAPPSGALRPAGPAGPVWQERAALASMDPVPGCAGRRMPGRSGRRSAACLQMEGKPSHSRLCGQCHVTPHLIISPSRKRGWQSPAMALGAGASATVL